MAIRNSRKSRSSYHNDASAYSRASYGSGDTSTYRDHQAGGRSGSMPNRAQHGSHAQAGDASQYSRSARDASAAHSSYSRDGVTNRMTQQRKQKRKKRLLVVLISILILGVLGVGAAFAYVMYLDSTMNDLDSEAASSLAVTDSPSDPFYMLLIGVDKSEERESDNVYGGSYRTDSMILCRVDPQNKKLTMISIARDLRIQLAGHGYQKINAAYAFGGAKGAIEAINTLAGVQINHYAEIDFDAFEAVVDSLGGIEYDVKYRLDDDYIDETIEPGLQTLNGHQALIVCRDRHSYDKVGDGDALRTANQRAILSAIMKKVMTSDPATMLNTVSTMAKYVTTDMSVSSILGVAQSMYGIDVDNDVYTAITPKTSEYVNGVWWDVIVEPDWTNMMTRVKQGLPPYAEDKVDATTGITVATSGDGGSSDSSSSSSSSDSTLSGVSISVKNGCGISGCADAAAAKLTPHGASCTTGNADNFKYSSTIVVYNNDSQADQASKIASYLGVGSAKKNTGTYSFTSDFLVVIGSDWS